MSFALVDFAHLRPGLGDGIAFRSVTRFLPSAAALFSLAIALRAAASLAQAWSKRSVDNTKGLEIPRRYPFVPGIFHLVLFWFKGPQYFRHMVPSLDSPIGRIVVFGRRVVIAHHSLDHDLAKSSKNITLRHFAASTAGKKLFGLSDSTCQSIMLRETQPVFHAAFLSPESLASLVSQSYRNIEYRISKIRNDEVWLCHWLFHATAKALACSLWDDDSPWVVSDDTMDDLMTFAETFQGLYLPLPQLVASRAFSARRRLINALMTHRKRRRAESGKILAHQFNVVALIDEQWDSNTDYYGVEILTALTLLSTAANAVGFLVRYLLSDNSLFREVESQIAGLRMKDGAVDMGRLFEACPLLVASWYEVLRLHITMIPRQVREDFILRDQWAFKTGDIIMLPGTSSNYDPMIWGLDYNNFVPSRFIHADGTLNQRLTRKVKGFGVAGNLCPGRYYGFGAAMGLVVSLILSIDIQSVSGRWPPPTAAKRYTAGFQRYGDDLRAILSKKPGLAENLRILNSGGLNKY